MAVSHVDTKKSSAGMRRLPDGPATSREASSASAVAGYSAAGSACANEPPTVPRLRIWIVADMRGRLDEQGYRRRVLAVFDAGLRRHGPNAHRAISWG